MKSTQHALPEIDAGWLLDSLREGAILVDRVSREIRFWNPAVERIFGVSSEEALGEAIGRFLPGLFAGAAPSPLPREFLTMHASGEPRIVEVVLRSLETGEAFLLLLSDVTNRRRAAEAHRRQHQAIVELFNHQALGGEDLDAELHATMEVAARTLEVGRASAWLYSDNNRYITCLDLYKRNEHEHERGGVLAAGDFPTYFEALGEDRIIAAADANLDPRTAEFSAPYLVPLGIGAMLDAPIHVGGRTVGVVCFEHLGGVREWLLEEQNFATSIADMVSLAIEQSHRRRAEASLRESEERLRTVVSNVPVFLFALDRKGCFTLGEGRGLQTLGLNPEQLKGQSIYDVYRDHAEILAHFERARAGDAFRAIADLAGSVFESWWSPVTAANGELTGVIGVAIDITERFSLDRMKTEFVSMVSHELRTPLTSIRGSLGLISSGVMGAVDPEAQELLSIALSSTERLVRLINDILDIERMESGKAALDLGPCMAPDLVNHSISALRAMADEAGVTLIHEAAPLALWADSDRVIQLLTNLLSNAIKFSPRNTQVRVSALPYGKDVLLQVADQGRGIPAEKLEHIFERFSQVDASDSREKGGTGLGLAICRSIVQQHGGKIRVESTPGEGTTFSCLLPGREVVNEEGLYWLQWPQEPLSPRVLIVERVMALLSCIRAAAAEEGVR